MTKIDKVCEQVCEDVSRVFCSISVRDCVDKVSMVMGLPRSQILPFKNYESEMDLDTNINILSLMSFRHILRLTDDYMNNFIGDLKQKKLRE